MDNEAKYKMLKLKNWEIISKVKIQKFEKVYSNDNVAN